MALKSGIANVLGLRGSKPNVPDLPPIDIGQVQSSAIQQNQAVLPDLFKQAGDINQFNADQLTKYIEQKVPGALSLLTKGTDVLKGFLAGEIPSDVASQVENKAAARSLSGGYGGTQLGRNLEARDLGLTSLDLTTKGLDSATTWLQGVQRLTTPNLFDVTSMFITPQQRLSFEFAEREAQFNVQWLRNRIKAMPSPNQAAMAESLDWVASTAGSLATYGLGGMTGGGGGGQGGNFSALMGGGGGGGASGAATGAAAGGYYGFGGV